MAPLLKRVHNRNMKRNPKEHLNGTITKRREVPKVPLCNLPEDVLSHILSLLPIDDAIRTGVVSRKWKYVWCHHTNLTFNSATMRKHYFKISCRFLSDEEFVTRVEAVLHQHSGAGVERMEVKFRLHNKHVDHINRWVSFAIASKTKELVIDLSGGYKASLPGDLSYAIHGGREEPYNVNSQLFSTDNGSYLQCLELTSVSLQLPADFKGFLNLKNLTLVDVSMTNEDVQCMLSRCNLLEFLEITYCRMVTSIQVTHPLDQLKHLVVDNCPLLQELELSCSPATLEYTGAVVPLVFASSSRLKNIRIKFLMTDHAAIDYIVTRFPRTLQSLETLTIHCAEPERTILPGSPFKFTYLRHLRMELVLHGDDGRNTDVFDYAYLLEVAPFMQKLELLMWMNCRYQPYCKEDGELRSRLPHQHAHLKSVRISGFFGRKDQVELALHILRSSLVLEKMEITPRVEVSICAAAAKECYERTAYAYGHEVATEFVCKADHRNVVVAIRASFSWGPPLDYGRGRRSEVQRGPRGGLLRGRKGWRGRRAAKTRTNWLSRC